MNWASTLFNEDIDPSKYASIILYLVSKAKQQSDIENTPREQALEMLTEVLKGNKYAKLAIKLLTEILICNFITSNKDLNSKFGVKNLNILLTNHLPTTPTISINAVTTSQHQNNSRSP